jgi:hypothetical protein
MKTGIVDSPRIAVAGHLVYDEITFPGGETTIALGGISYNIAALAALMAQGKIIPVCEIGLDIKDLVFGTFGSYEVFDKSAIKMTSLPNVINRLVYDNQGNRNEWNSRRPQPLLLEAIPDDIDALLLNFISGNDVTLEELRRFPGRFGGIVYCDFHSLALGHDQDGRRYHRRHPDWQEYLSHVDIIQMNLAELATIVGHDSGGKLQIAADCRILHQAGPETALITMGKDGVLLSNQSGDQAFHIPASDVPAVVDTTGCGDTLAAAMTYHYIVSGDLLRSAVKANRYAAAKATFSGVDGFLRMDEILGNIGEGPEPVRL